MKIKGKYDAQENSFSFTLFSKEDILKAIKFLSSNNFLNHQESHKIIIKTQSLSSITTYFKNNESLLKIKGKYDAQENSFSFTLFSKEDILKAIKFLSSNNFLNHQESHKIIIKTQSLSSITTYFKSNESLLKIKGKYDAQENSFSFTLFSKEDILKAIKFLSSNNASPIEDIPIKISKKSIRIYSEK